MAFQFLQFSDLMEGINRNPPMPPEDELDAMLEGEIVPTVAVEVSGCIECLIFEYLPLVIRALQHATNVTPAQLERDFLEHQDC